MVLRQKINLYPYLTLQRKNNSRWFLDLNVKGETVELLEDDTGEHLHGLEVVKVF